MRSYASDMFRGLKLVSLLETAIPDALGQPTYIPVQDGLLSIEKRLVFMYPKFYLVTPPRPLNPGPSASMQTTTLFVPLNGSRSLIYIRSACTGLRFSILQPHFPASFFLTSSVEKE